MARPARRDAADRSSQPSAIDSFRTLRRRRRRVAALGQRVEFALLLMMDGRSISDLLEQLRLPNGFPGNVTGQ